MAYEAVVVVRSTKVDGFPSEGAVCFIWDSDVYTGWPLIDYDGRYTDNRHFCSPERAKASPEEVVWEASEDRVHGVFRGVTHWFDKPKQTKI